MTALLKEQTQDHRSIHARRINRSHWAAVAQEIRGILSRDNAFKPWEVDAIIESLLEIVGAGGQLTADRLAAALHSRQFPKAEAQALSQAISRAYG